MAHDKERVDPKPSRPSNPRPKDYPFPLDNPRPTPDTGEGAGDRPTR